MRFLIYSFYSFYPIFSPFSVPRCSLFFLRLDCMAHHFNSPACVTQSLAPFPPLLSPGFHPLLCLFHSGIQGAEYSWRKTQPVWLCGCELRKLNFSRNSALSTHPGHFAHPPRGLFMAPLFPNSSSSLSAGSCFLFV